MEREIPQEIIPQKSSKTIIKKSIGRRKNLDILSSKCYHSLMPKKQNKTSNIKEYAKKYALKNKEKIAAQRREYHKRTYKPKTKPFNEKEFQKKCLETNFNYSQYWLMSYTELRRDNQKLKFKTIIQARSSISATGILEKKTSLDNPDSKIINLKIKMFHKEFKLNKKKLSLVNWMDIKNCSFPNEVNILFKHHDG